MEIYTINEKSNDKNKILTDNSPRTNALIRWEKFKINTKRAKLYNSHSPNLMPKEQSYIFEIEKDYVSIYSEWETENISKEQYTVLQEHLSPEYFIDIIAIYICYHHPHLSDTVESVKTTNFELSCSDKKDFINYLQLTYLPTVIDTIPSLKDLRPRKEIYTEMLELGAKLINNTRAHLKTKEPLCEYEQVELSNLLTELEMGMDIFMACFNAHQKAETNTPPKFWTSVKPEILSSIIPAKAIICNSKIANELIAIDNASLTGNTVNVSVGMSGKGKNKRKIKTEVYISYDFDDKNIAITGRPLTPYDKAVHDAICTLYEAGNPCFTPEMVYRAMNGLTNSERIVIERGTLDPIIDSIEVGTLRRVTINAEEQMKRYPEIEKSGYRNYFLPLAEAFVTVNGEEKRGYKFLSAPPLYEYSKNIKQVISIDMELLDSREQLKNSPTVTLIRYYLLRRIATMKSTKAALSNQNIRYSELFIETGIDENALTHTQRDRKRSQIQKILGHFKITGYITDYAEYKKGRKFEGITIIL